MALTLVLFDSSLEVGSLSFSDWGKGRVMRELERIANSLSIGSNTGSVDVQSAPVYATGTITLSGATGAVGATIGGTLKTVTASGGDTATAAALAAAINADATLDDYVVATSAAGVVTLRALLPGTIGNGITLVASGTGSTVSGAKLGAGTGTPGTGAPGNSFSC